MTVCVVVIPLIMVISVNTEDVLMTVLEMVTVTLLLVFVLVMKDG